AKDEKIGFSMINAKSETLGEKPSFYPSFKTKRCVILADGFYEWKKEQKQKTPMRIVLKDQKIFPMAGLWSTYQRSDGSKFFTCTIITTSANDLMASIHDRMPVILTEENQKAWLNPRNTDLDMLSKVLVPYDSTKMHAYLVSNLVNKASNDLYECIQPIEKA
ncbi:MAG: SOS response-associated peptidase, partial [Acholeplasmataceae bacterium]|nr:SOS response-associated peptidase [Acholeplasmataceae bacterium]